MSIHRAARCENVPEFPESTANFPTYTLVTSTRKVASRLGAVSRTAHPPPHQPTGSCPTPDSGGRSSGFQSYRHRLRFPAATFFFDHNSRPDGASAAFPSKLARFENPGRAGLTTRADDTRPQTVFAPNAILPRSANAAAGSGQSRFPQPRSPPPRGPPQAFCPPDATHPRSIGRHLEILQPVGSTDPDQFPSLRRPVNRRDQFHAPPPLGSAQRRLRSA